MPEDNTVLGANAVAEIERIVRLGTTRIVDVDEGEFTSLPVFLPPEPRCEPEPKAIALHTLQSFADYTKSCIDKSYVAPRGAFVHVESPTTVRLLTEIFGERNQRVCVAVAGATIPGFLFGQYYDQESFVILIQTCFAPELDRAKVLEVVGNLTDETVKTYTDDGVTQVAAMKAGVVRKAEAKVPNPVILRPYRTFAEIEQPDSPFILRLRGGGEGKLPSCGLFECDGGLWRIPAVRLVRDWLRQEIPEETSIFA